MKRQWEKDKYVELIDLYTALEAKDKGKTEIKAFRSYPYIFMTMNSTIFVEELLPLVNEHLKGDKSIDILDDNILFIKYIKAKEMGGIKVEVEYKLQSWADSLTVEFYTDTFPAKKRILDNIEELIEKDVRILNTSVIKVINYANNGNK